MREAERIAALEERVDVLEACLDEIARHLHLRRVPGALPPPRPPRASPPRRQGTPAGPALRPVAE